MSASAWRCGCSVQNSLVRKLIGGFSCSIYEAIPLEKKISKPIRWNDEMRYPIFFSFSVVVFTEWETKSHCHMPISSTLMSTSIVSTLWAIDNILYRSCQFEYLPTRRRCFFFVVDSHVTCFWHMNRGCPDLQETLCLTFRPAALYSCLLLTKIASPLPWQVTGRYHISSLIRSASGLSTSQIANIGWFSYANIPWLSSWDAICYQTCALDWFILASLLWGAVTDVGHYEKVWIHCPTS